MNIGVKDVLKRINLFFILYLLLLCACLVVKLIYTKEEIYFAVNRYYHGFADFFFKYATYFGDGLLTIAIAVILLCFFSYRKAFLLVSSYAVTSIFAQILKHFFDAPRPQLYFATRLGEIHFVEGVEIYKLHSFPSGHSVTVFSTAVVLAYFSGKKPVNLLLLIIAILTGYSRMYLSEHFFEDVVAGSAIGVLLTVVWLSWIESKKFLHAKKWNTALFKKKGR
ncbi:phosphatase PAP2 family protein [Mucilaginibacter limnophilus]|nr:phosphatase PAP2 family protein [Mucilaginibacter limnophilus]